MKKLVVLLLALAIMLPCAAALTPTAAEADSMYIIPHSAGANARELTYEEVWEYQYDTLLYAFNEIYARHGYKFETGSRCYNWFTRMPWYKPNASESSTNHHETYSQCSKIENHNVDLIKAVRKEMRALGTTNPGGKGMPTPPAEVQNRPRLCTAGRQSEVRRVFRSVHGCLPGSQRQGNGQHQRPGVCPGPGSRLDADAL